MCCDLIFIACYHRFTNPAYNTPVPAHSYSPPDREMNAVRIVKRGNTVGYDNPCFDSPVDFFKKLSGPRLSSMEWSDSPAIGSGHPVICEGSSTPRVRDGDSAFLEPSSAVSTDTFIQDKFHK